MGDIYSVHVVTDNRQRAVELLKFALNDRRTKEASMEALTDDMRGAPDEPAPAAETPDGIEFERLADFLTATSEQDDEPMGTIILNLSSLVPGAVVDFFDRLVSKE